MEMRKGSPDPVSSAVPSSPRTLSLNLVNPRDTQFQNHISSPKSLFYKWGNRLREFSKATQQIGNKFGTGNSASWLLVTKPTAYSYPRIWKDEFVSFLWALLVEWLITKLYQNHLPIPEPLTASSQFFLKVCLNQYDLGRTPLELFPRVKFFFIGAF